MTQPIIKGATSQSVTLEGFDDTGLPLTGKVAADLPTIYYRVHGSLAAVAIPLHDVANITDAYYSTAGNYGFKEAGGGRYRLDLPDAIGALDCGSRVDIWGEASGKHYFVPGGLFVDVLKNSSGHLLRVATADTVADISSIIAASLADSGTAQAGGESTITLRAGASSVDNIHKDQAIVITGGTGAKQTNRGMSYNGTSKVLTVKDAWLVAPDNTSTYMILGRIG